MARCCDRTGSAVSVSGMDEYTTDRGTDALPHSTVDLARAKCFGAVPVINIFQGQPANIALWAFDKNGSPVDLSGTGPYECYLIMKDAPTCYHKRFKVTGTIDSTDAAKGKVNVTLDHVNTHFAGIYYAQLVIEDDHHNTLWLNNYWLVINPSLDGKPSGIISIAEVRLILRDECPAQNFLLDDFEFNDSQIMACIRMPVDEFNEKYQPRTTYSPRNFPWRFHWTRAAAGYALNIAAHGYARDHLPYQAGGVAVDDKNKMASYLQLSKQLLDEWRVFIRETKLQLNIAGGYGVLKSAYIRGRVI